MGRLIIILCILLCSIVAQAESIHFRVIFKIKQADLKDVGQKINGNGQIISIDEDVLTFSNHNKAFTISDQLYEESNNDKYFSFTYSDHKRKFYGVVLFDKKGETVIVITDENGIGYLYFVEII